MRRRRRPATMQRWVKGERGKPQDTIRDGVVPRLYDRGCSAWGRRPRKLGKLLSGRARRPRARDACRLPYVAQGACPPVRHFRALRRADRSREGQCFDRAAASDRVCHPSRAGCCCLTAAIRPPQALGVFLPRGNPLQTTCKLSRSYAAKRTRFEEKFRPEAVSPRSRFLPARRIPGGILRRAGLRLRGFPRARDWQNTAAAGCRHRPCRSTIPVLG